MRTIEQIIAEVRTTLHDVEELLDELVDVAGEDVVRSITGQVLGDVPSFLFYPAGFACEGETAPGESGTATVKTMLVEKGIVPAKGFKIIVPSPLCDSFQIDSLLWDDEEMFPAPPIPAGAFSLEAYAAPLDLPVVRDKDVLIQVGVTNTGPLPQRFHGMIMFKVPSKLAEIDESRSSPEPTLDELLDDEAMRINCKPGVAIPNDGASAMIETEDRHCVECGTDFVLLPLRCGHRVCSGACEEVHRCLVRP